MIIGPGIATYFLAQRPDRTPGFAFIQLTSSPQGKIEPAAEFLSALGHRCFNPWTPQIRNNYFDVLANQEDRREPLPKEVNDIVIFAV